MIKRLILLFMIVSFSSMALALDTLKVDDGGVLKSDLTTSYKTNYGTLFCEDLNIRSSYPTVSESQCKSTVADVIDICIQYHLPNMPNKLYIEKKAKKWSKSNGLSYWSNILNLCISEKYYLIYKSVSVTPTDTKE